MVARQHLSTADGRDALAGYPRVRRIRFPFGEPAPMNHHFIEGNIPYSHLIAVLSALFPPGEESFIRSVRRFSDRITDPALAKRVAGFIGQESVHGQEHRRLNERLIAMGYPVVRVFTFDRDSRRQRFVLRLENRSPALAHLAMTAAAEHYTATLAQRVLSSSEIQRMPFDPEVRNLFNWHALEELEHKSVAFDVYRAAGGPEWLRIAVMALAYSLTIPLVTLAVLVSIATDPWGWRPRTVLRQMFEIFRSPLIKGLMADLRVYMRPGFHPDDVDTTALVAQWSQELFGDAGHLVGHLR